MSDVGWMVTYDGRSGGAWVRRQVVDGLAGAVDIEEVTVDAGLAPRQFVSGAWELATYDDPAVDCWVESLSSLAVRGPGRRTPNVLALHHLPTPSPTESLGDALSAVKSALVRLRLREIDHIVVVSDFWAHYLEARGLGDRVTTIYNGLPVDRFDFDEAAVAETRERLCDDPDEPLIHVGPCAPGKGGRRVAETLADWDATLVTTGRTDSEAPVTHLDLPYDEYLTVLAACDAVVAMSAFPEGWGLQVQEAMLARTPVVGSGRGGMGMLLEGGDQVVCEAWADLEASVGRALDERERLGERGREYASQFTRERMIEEWGAFFEEVLGP